MEEGRVEVTTEGDVARIAVRGSRTSNMEAELLSADVDDRRVTEDAAIAGSDFTRKATEASPKTKQMYFPVDQEVCRNPGLEHAHRARWIFVLVAELPCWETLFAVVAGRGVHMTILRKRATSSSLVPWYYQN